MSDDVLIKVEQVSKKFCRGLKRALWYGVRDIGNELLGRDGHHEQLRPGEFWAVDDVSFEVRRGECLGLIGPNGAGKSTLLKLLNGLIKPDEGRIAMRGRVGALIELGTGFNPILTGRENISNNAAVLGIRKRDIDTKLDDIVAFAELPPDALDAPVQTYSSGMKVRLGFAVAASLEPDIVLVDEVLAVGDMAFRMKCFGHMLRLRQHSKTIVLVSHNMVDINRVCDRVVVMQRGCRSFDGGVGDGVGHYEKLLLRERTSVSAETGCVAWVESLQLLNSRGEATTEFQTGDDLVGVVTCRSTTEIRGARLNVHLESPSQGKLAGFATSHAGLSMNLMPGLTELRFRLRRLPLLMGGYSFSVYLYGAGLDKLLHAAACIAQFAIVGPRPDNFGRGLSGTFLLDPVWEVDRGDGQSLSNVGTVGTGAEAVHGQRAFAPGVSPLAGGTTGRTRVPGPDRP